MIINYLITKVDAKREDNIPPETQMGISNNITVLDVEKDEKFKVLKFQFRRKHNNKQIHKGRKQAADVKKPLLELISNATVKDLSGFNGCKDRLLNEISSLDNENPILIFEQGSGFSFIRKGKEEKIEINYDFDELKSWIKYI